MMKLFGLFVSLECKYNKLQLSIRISSIEASKLTLCISMALYVYNKFYCEEIHPVVTPFSRVKGFRVTSGTHGDLAFHQRPFVAAVAMVSHVVVVLIIFPTRPVQLEVKLFLF